MSIENNAGSPATAELCLPVRLRKPRLRRAEASEYLAIAHGIEIAVATLAKWASIGSTGPGYQLSGRYPLYSVDGLDRWAAERLGPMRRSTSDTGAS